MKILIESLQKLAYFVRATDSISEALRDDLLNEIVYLDDRITDDINTLKDKLRHVISDHAADLDLIEDEKKKRKEIHENAMELETRIFRLISAQENLKPIQDNLYHEKISPNKALEEINTLDKKYFLENYYSKKLRTIVNTISFSEGEETPISDLLSPHSELSTPISQQTVPTQQIPQTQPAMNDRSINVQEGQVNVNDKSVNVNVQFDVNVPKQD